MANICAGATTTVYRNPGLTRVFNRKQQIIPNGAISSGIKIFADCFAGDQVFRNRNPVAIMPGLHALLQQPLLELVQRQGSRHACHFMTIPKQDQRGNGANRPQGPKLFFGLGIHFGKS